MRYPFFLGFWKKSIPYVDETFADDDYDEPHLKRKREILIKHPEIKKLYGFSTKTKYMFWIIHFGHIHLYAMDRKVVQFCVICLF